MPINIDESIAQLEKLEKPMTEGRKKQSLKHEAQGKSMNRQIIDELLNKARSYPKVEGYLRDLDKRRIDEGEDVPVTKREKAVRQADENAAKRLESQVKSSKSDLEKAKKWLQDKSGRDITEQMTGEKFKREKSMDQSTFDYILKCHSHVLGGETEDSLKTKKKQAPKAKDHVFGNDSNDDRGSEYEMVEVKEPEAYKSEESDLVKSIEALLEKATYYYGVGSREGKIYVQGTHKNPKAHGKVSSPQLSEARKKEIIESSRKKALTQAEMGGLYGQANKLRTAKSIDERTVDLVRSLNVDYGPRKSGVRRGGFRQDPDAYKRELEDKLIEDDEAGKIKWKPLPGNPEYDKSLKSDLQKSNKRKERKADLNKENVFYANKDAGLPHKVNLGTKAANFGSQINAKSLDDRTCDLVKDLTKDLTKEREKEIHSAVMAARMIKHDVPGADKMDYKPEDFARVMRTHNNIDAKRSLKSVIDTWKDGSPYITKGSTIMPLGPGGQIQDLTKDDNKEDDEGAE